MPRTIAEIDAMDPLDRMKLSTKDMPTYGQGNPALPLVGETRDHYPDGTFKARRQPDWKEKAIG